MLTRGILHLRKSIFHGNLLRAENTAEVSGGGRIAPVTEVGRVGYGILHDDVFGSMLQGTRPGENALNACRIWRDDSYCGESDARLLDRAYTSNRTSDGPQRPRQPPCRLRQSGCLRREHLRMHRVPPMYGYSPCGSPERNAPVTPVLYSPCLNPGAYRARSAFGTTRLVCW